MTVAATPESTSASRATKTLTATHGPVAEVDHDHQALMPKLYSELERRFFIPNSQLESAIDLDTLPSVQIEQSYFPEDTRKVLGVLTLAHGELGEMLGRLDITQARLRKITDRDEVSYALEIKARSPEGLKIENKELRYPLEINKQVYDALLPFTDGTFCKERHLLQGKTIEPGDNDGKPFTVEIDLPKWQEINGERRSLKGLNVAWLEVESADTDVLQLVQNGHHDVPILRQSLEVSRDVTEADLRKPLGSKRIAVQEDFDVLVSAAKALHKAWKREMKAALAA